jgi:hypothetical protein
MRGRRARSLSASLKAGTTITITLAPPSQHDTGSLAAILALLDPTAPGIVNAGAVLTRAILCRLNSSQLISASRPRASGRIGGATIAAAPQARPLNHGRSCMAVHKCAQETPSFRHESEPLYRRPGTSRILLPGCGLELDDQPGRHPSTVFHADAVRLGPLADLGGVQPACSRPASAAGWPPGTAPGPAGSMDRARQRLSQRPGMPGAQVDLIPGAVRPEPDGAPAWVPTRSPMDRVGVFWATDAPSPGLIWRADAGRSGPRERPAAPVCPAAPGLR